MRSFKLDFGQPLAVLALLVILSTAFAVIEEPETFTLKAPQTRKQPGRELTAMIFDHVRTGNLEAVRLYLDSGYTPNAVNERGDSLLFLAAYQGQKDILKLLLNQPDVEVNFQ